MRFGISDRLGTTVLGEATLEETVVSEVEEPQVVEEEPLKKAKHSPRKRTGK
jgi:hypothetical protein